MTHGEIVALVDDMIAEGIEHTNYGSWCFYFDEIGDEAVEAIDEIVDELYKREEVCDVDVCEDCIDVNFYTGYCPHVEDEEDDKMELRIGLAKKGTIDSKIARRESPFEGIEEFLYYRVSDTAIAKVPDVFGDNSAWAEAERNTVGEIKVTSLGEIMAELTGMSIPDDSPTQWVVTNKNGYLGAATILATQEIAKVTGHGTFVMLPSSIHEVLLVPEEEGADLTPYTAMVRDINETQVAPADRLSDRAYVITL